MLPSGPVGGGRLGGLLLAGIILLSCGDREPEVPERSLPQFQHQLIDEHGPLNPWMKAVGDVDGDGFPDVVVGGQEGPLVWYRWPKWEVREIAQGGYRTVDGQLADMDADGDLDVVVGGLLWFENPGTETLVQGSLWQPHQVADHSTHDIEVADLDSDGDLDIVTRDQSEFGTLAGNQIFLWRQDNGENWHRFVLNCPHGEGLATADLDRDGDSDILIGGIWFENPGHVVAQWDQHSFAAWHTSSSIATGDLNGDGRLDVVLAPAELQNQYYRISWFEAPPDPRTLEWHEHVLLTGVEAVYHSLQLADFNNDGRLDVATAEMHQGRDPDEVIVLLNLSTGDDWEKLVLSQSGSHQLQAADLGSDGDIDLVGANWSGDLQRVEWWENLSAP